MSEMNIKLKPWTTPNFAVMEMPAGLKQDGPQQLPSIPLADLTQQALDDLVQEWLDTVYRRAGKPSGWTKVRSQK